MKVDCAQPDYLLQICRQARLEIAQTTFGKAGQKTTSPSDQRGESKTVSHPRLKRMEQQVSPEAEKEERPP